MAKKPDTIFAGGESKERKEWVEKGKELIDEMGRTYCSKCDNDEISVFMTIKVHCKKCGHTRLIQKALKAKGKR